MPKTPGLVKQMLEKQLSGLFEERAWQSNKKVLFRSTLSL
jgi:hypothetical protein